MRTIGFIGAYDKIDLILYVARILTQMNKKVMVVDSTILQKSKYIVPAVSLSKTYVTEFEGIDVAIGLYDYASIKDYLGIPQHAVLDYDYIFIDVDSPESFNDFELKNAAKNYFVSGFDLYSLKRGLEILSGVEETVTLTKVLFSKNVTREEDEYLNYLSLGSKITWNEEKIYFPFESGDQTVIYENQRVAKIKLKKLSSFYKESLMYLVEQLIEQNEVMELKKAFKLLEKGV